jgi:hypothetical protein
MKNEELRTKNEQSFLILNSSFFILCPRKKLSLRQRKALAVIGCQMSVLLVVIIPLAWALTGKLLGLAVAASYFYSARGTRAGRTISRWCVPVFPIIYLVLIFLGGSGTAGTGVRLFGSEELFGLTAGIPIYTLIPLALYAGALYVARDLTLGHEPQARNDTL